MKRLQVVAFYPEQAKHWGERITLMVCPQRAVLPERLAVASQSARDYVVECLQLGVTTVHPLPIGWPGFPSRWPALVPPLGAYLSIRARYLSPPRPWLRGTRAARKAARARYWRAEHQRKPCAFYASLICEAAS